MLMLRQALNHYASHVGEMRANGLKPIRFRDWLRWYAYYITRSARR
jgi:hypothetical protein